MKSGSTLTYLHGDHLGSTALATTSGGAWQSQEKYFAYGKDRDSANNVPTDHRYTGQKSDGSGLMYYSSRYYDPQIGLFVSPDTIVADPGRAFAYNRAMYVYGNPLLYSDPSGHCIAEGQDGYDSEENSACWNNIDLLLLNWEQDAIWWEGLFGTQENFMKFVANNAEVDVWDVAGLLGIYHHSDSYLGLNGLSTGKFTEHPAPHLTTWGEALSECVNSGTCTTFALDGIGVGSGIVGVACIPAIVACGTVVGGTATIVGIGSAVYGSYLTYVNPNATNSDKTVATVTTISGVGFSYLGKPIAGLIVSLAQTVWDGHSATRPSDTTQSEEGKK